MVRGHQDARIMIFINAHIFGLRIIMSKWPPLKLYLQLTPSLLLADIYFSNFSGWTLTFQLFVSLCQAELIQSVCIRSARNKRQQLQECKRTGEGEGFRPGAAVKHVQPSPFKRRVGWRQRGIKVKFNVRQGQVALECVQVEAMQWSTSPPSFLLVHPLLPPSSLTPLPTREVTGPYSGAAPSKTKLLLQWFSDRCK